MDLPTHEDLRRKLLRIDGRGYKAYKEIQGRYAFPFFTLLIDHVQGDPFAAPSRLRACLPQTVAGFPPELHQARSRQVALRDYLTRQFDRQARRATERRGSGKSGLLAVDRPGQEVLERSAVLVDGERVEARFVAGLPARGRSVLGRQAAEMLCEDLPGIVEHALLFAKLSRQELTRHVQTVEDADWLRGRLRESGLLAFVAEGSVLPRRSGVDQRPLPEGAVPFQSPPSLRVSFQRPNLGPISGMGVPRGVTLVVGGGYHGKSTLLQAVERGVYNHIPGDGREFVVTDPDAVKIRAEDGRRVAGVDISAFINNLPQGRSTDFFMTENASGSTSQAANIVEALEAGARALLVDEDTAATNFMIRDHRMQELIVKELEPITPFIDKVRQLLDEHGVSTLLVIGGSGDYFDVADCVIAMENFLPQDVTARARAIAGKYAAERRPEGGSGFGPVRPRVPLPQSLDPSRGRHEAKLRAYDTETIVFGAHDIDLSSVEQVVDPGQLRAIAHALVYAKRRYMDGRRPLPEILERVMRDIEDRGLDVLAPFVTGDLAGFRPLELAAALNRLRTLAVR